LCRVTVVGSTRRLDVALPAGVPVVDLLSDLVEMLGESEDGTPAGWGLVRVGGRALDPEHGLVEQGVADGTMLFLRDLTTPAPEPAIDDYAERVAISVDAQGGRWTNSAAEALVVYGAGTCLLAAGAIALLAGDRGVRTMVGLAGAALAALAGLGVARVLRRRAFGGLIAFAALPLWAAAGVGLAGFARLDPTGTLAAALLSVTAGAGVAIAIAAELTLVPSVGVITATLVPALVLGACALFGAGFAAAAALLVPLALGSLALPAPLAMRLARLDDPGAGSLDARVRRARRLLAAFLIGVAVVLAVSSEILVASGGWFAWGLVAAGAIGAAARARHFRFTAEVAPLLAAGLAGLLLLQYPLVVELAGWGAGGAAIVLIVDAIVLIGVGTGIRGLNVPPRLQRPLARLEAVVTAASVPLSLGVLGAYEAVAHFARGLV
jgi:ESX secretion system protein EccD